MFSVYNIVSMRRVGGVNTICDKTRQFCFVSTHLPICNCSVSNILRTTENLEIGNWVKTRQNCFVCNCVYTADTDKTRQDCLVLSVSAVWTSYYSQLQTKQDKTVLSCLQLSSYRRRGQDKTVLSCSRRWCDQAVTSSSSSVYFALDWNCWHRSIMANIHGNQRIQVRGSLELHIGRL